MILFWDYINSLDIFAALLETTFKNRSLWRPIEENSLSTLFYKHQHRKSNNHSENSLKTWTLAALKFNGVVKIYRRNIS